MKSLNKVILVGSTNPKANAKLCAINKRRNNLSTPILVGERVGRKAHAVLECSTVNMNSKKVTPTGDFDAITNKNRISEKMTTKLGKKLGWIS